MPTFFSTRRIALTGLIFLLTVSATRGQGAPEKPTDAWVNHIRSEWSELHLTTEQEDKLGVILTDVSAQAATLAKELEKVPAPEREARTMAFRTATLPKVMALLTGEQKQVLRRNRAKRGSQISAKAYRIALASIDLSEDQKVKGEACLAAYQKNMEEAMASLPVEGPVTDAVRATIRAPMDEMRRVLDEILTPEQQEKLNGMMGTYK